MNHPFTSGPFPFNTMVPLSSYLALSFTFFSYPMHLFSFLLQLPKEPLQNKSIKRYPHLRNTSQRSFKTKEGSKILLEIFKQRKIMSSSSSVVWSREEDRAFENAIAMHWIEDSKEQWDKIAIMVPSKSIDELKQHYKVLVADVEAIEAGLVALPKYTREETSSSTKDHQGFSGITTNERRSNCGYGSAFTGLGHDSSGQGGGKGGSRSEQERRKGIPWTEEEHRLFLLGLDKFGKGDWRSISRNFVISRSPTQVASHAQKYFIRLNSMNRDRRRSSIHDITSVNNGEVSSHQAPITGQQTNTTPSATAAAIGPTMKHRGQQSMHGLGVYGAPIGHPVAAPPGHIASAVGTPVMLPHGHHNPYVVPIAYPMAPPPTMHQ